MKTFFLLALLVALAGCSSDSKDIAENATELAKLPQWTQIALILKGPLELLAVAIVLNGGISFFTVNRYTSKKGGDK